MKKTFDVFTEGPVFKSQSYQNSFMISKRSGETRNRYHSSRDRIFGLIMVEKSLSEEASRAETMLAR